MNRKQILLYVCEKILPQLTDFQRDAINLDGTPSLKPVLDVVRIVEAFRRKNGYPSAENMDAVVDDGYLYINGIHVGRIGPKMPKMTITEECEYYESKCIADCEL